MSRILTGGRLQALGFSADLSGVSNHAKIFIEHELASSSETVARFVIVLTTILSAAVIGVAGAMLPDSDARTMVMAYHTLILCGSFLIPYIPRIKGWNYRRHLFASSFHYIGFHAWYLYGALAADAEVARLYPMTMLYGMILTSLIAQVVSPRLIATGALIYFLMAAYAASPYLDATISAWLVTLFAGEVFVCYLKFHSDAVRRTLLQAVHEREQKLAASEALRMQTEMEQMNVRLSAIKEATQHFAHDVRKPFALLDLFLKLVRQESDQDTVWSLVNRYSPALSSASKRATGYISDLLELDATSTTERSEVVLTSMLKEALEIVFLGQNANDVGFEYGCGLQSRLWVNEYKVVRVLINIIDNARQAMGATGIIRFAAEDAGQGMVRLRVGNTNSHIAPEDLTRLFQPFFTKGKKDGTGLGLAVCLKIVEGHGGQITCRSADGYTEFDLTLPGTYLNGADLGPRLPMRAAAMEADQRSGDTGGCELKIGRSRPLVLVVDDDPFILELWQGAMIDADVRTVSSSREFWHLFAELKRTSTEVTAVILDYYLSDHSFEDTGVEVATRLRAEGFERPIVLSTHRMFDHGSLGLFDRVIDKAPAQWSEIAAAIGRKVG